jgi:hypothetical protein
MQKLEVVTIVVIKYRVNDSRGVGRILKKGEELKLRKSLEPVKRSNLEQ